MRLTELPVTWFLQPPSEVHVWKGVFCTVPYPVPVPIVHVLTAGPIAHSGRKMSRHALYLHARLNFVVL